MLNWLLTLIMKSKLIILNFLIWQRISSLFLIYCFLSKINVFIMFMLLFKMGLPPFHFWFWNVQKYWRLKRFLVFISIHKILPIIIFLNNLKINWFLITLSLFGILFFLKEIRIKRMIFGLRILESVWLVFSWFRSLKIFIIYLTLNFLIIIIIDMCLINNWYSDFDLSLIITLIIGLPPFVSFFLKMIIIGDIIILLSLILMFLSWVNLFFYWFWFRSVILIKVMKVKINLIIFLIIISNMVIITIIF